MPLVPFETLDTNLKCALWEIAEEVSFFKNLLPLSDDDLAQLNKIKGTQRQLHWLSARAIIYELCKDVNNGRIIKDEHGKPQLTEGGNISFSHSGKYSAAVFDKHRLVGIDIQNRVEKITRIAPKFISDGEYIDDLPRVDQMHYIWGCLLYTSPSPRDA